MFCNVSLFGTLFGGEGEAKFYGKEFYGHLFFDELWTDRMFILLPHLNLSYQESPRETKPKKAPKQKVHEFRPFL